MTDISDMIRWNAGFVRGLAQSVLERAKAIRGSLQTVTSETVGAAAAAVGLTESPAVAKSVAPKSKARKAPAAKTKKKTLATAKRTARTPGKGRKKSSDA